MSEGWWWVGGGLSFFFNFFIMKVIFIPSTNKHFLTTMPNVESLVLKVHNLATMGQKILFWAIFSSSSAHRLDGPHVLCIKMTGSQPQCPIF